MKLAGSLIIAILILIAPIYSQQSPTPLLERRVTVTVTNERLDAALRKVADAGGFSFSYSPSVIQTSKIVSYSFTNESVREILDRMFGGSIEYKVRSKHIILTKAKDTSDNKDEAVLSGYVVDESTGEKLKNVSIYEPVTLSSAVTDSYGYFEIKINKPPADVKLLINKVEYADTAIAVDRTNRRLLNIPIKIDKKKISVMADSVGQKIKRFWKTRIMNPPEPNLLNIDDSLSREFQFSIIPFVGNNGRLSGNVVNDYSFNLFGGYSGGTRKFEFGGLFNIDRNNVSYGQVAGLFNMVGGSTTAFQLAGLFNANFENSFGGQVAGLANVNWNGVTGGSVAGLVNFNRVRSHGAYIAGLSNFTLGEQEGAHIAGLINFATEESDGAQIAGLSNFAAKHYEGSQIAGLFNFTAGDVTGSQIAGALNFTGSDIRGSQIAGVMNFASRVSGSQIALLNICDSIRGVPLGLVSIVMKGYHKLELSADETFHTNIAFRTGVSKFYNILTAGAIPETFKENETYWTFGYGIGTAPRLTKWASMNVDLTANQVMDRPNLDVLNLLNKLHVGVDLHVTKNFSFYLGGTLNAHVIKIDGEYKPLFTDYDPPIIYERDFSDDLNVRMWLGGKLGVRFL